MFRADLHIHSRYSRATSKKLTLQNLAAWASIKGIHLVSTGDINHPQWREEIKNEQLPVQVVLMGNLAKLSS